MLLNTGEITISLNMSNYSPLNPDDKEHQKASARAQDYNVINIVSGLIKPYDT